MQGLDIRLATLRGLRVEICAQTVSCTPQNLTALSERTFHRVPPAGAAAAEACGGGLLRLAVHEPRHTGHDQSQRHCAANDHAAIVERERLCDLKNRSILTHMIHNGNLDLPPDLVVGPTIAELCTTPPSCTHVRQAGKAVCVPRC